MNRYLYVENIFSSQNFIHITNKHYPNYFDTFCDTEMRAVNFSQIIYFLFRVKNCFNDERVKNQISTANANNAQYEISQHYRCLPRRLARDSSFAK